MKAKYRILKGSYSKKTGRGTQIFKVGDVVELNETEAKKQASSIELIENAASVRLASPPIKPPTKVIETEKPPYIPREDLEELTEGKSDGEQALAEHDEAYGKPAPTDNTEDSITPPAEDIVIPLPETTTTGIATADFVQVGADKHLDGNTGITYTLEDGELIAEE